MQEDGLIFQWQQEPVFCKRCRTAFVLALGLAGFGWVVFSVKSGELPREEGLHGEVRFLDLDRPEMGEFRSALWRDFVVENELLEISNEALDKVLEEIEAENRSAAYLPKLAPLPVPEAEFAQASLIGRFTLPPVESVTAVSVKGPKQENVTTTRHVLVMIDAQGRRREWNWQAELGLFLEGELAAFLVGVDAGGRVREAVFLAGERGVEVQPFLEENLGGGATGPLRWETRRFFGETANDKSKL